MAEAVSSGAALFATLSLVAAVSSAQLLPAPGDASAPSRQPTSSDANRPALSPAEALRSFVLEPGFRIDLVAAEPLVQDPVAIAFDERGRMYVAENRGYPDPLEGEPTPEPQGVIALLTDTDDDGRFDTRTDFATGLTYPNGLMVWDGGVFVTVAPDLLYLKDTTGDGIADQRRVVLTGFNANRTAQIRFSHPTLGPDNWVYLTSGLNGGRVTAPDHPERPAVEFASSDSRFNPRTFEFELVGGQGQYGLTFDDQGRRFICSNRHPVWHVVLEPRQLQRNPNLAFSETVQEVSKVGAEAVVWPLTRDLTTASFHPTLMTAQHAGTFTAASGVHLHRGDALPEGHRGSVFISESAQNLVQRQVREPDGVSFKSHPARKGVEFLASRDTWFRPVFATNGPDGALYIADMYRKDIDHPAYVPEASRRLFDFTAGRGLGRIYRVAALDRPPARTTVGLDQAPIDRLVSSLEHPNAWWQDTARRLLVERQALGAVPQLRELAGSGPLVAQAFRPAGRAESGRLQALWVLDGLGVLTDEDIVRAVRDQFAGVRENGVRLAETRLHSSPKLLDALLPLQDDPDPRVRLHLALALGAVDDPRSIEVLASIARRDGIDRWVRAAVFSSVRGRTNAFVEAFVSAPPASLAVRAAVMQDLGRLFGASETAERCVALLTEIADPREELSWQPSAISGIAQGLRARGMSGDSQSALMALVSADTPQARLARERLATQMARAAAIAAIDEAPADQRLPAIELLGQGEWPDTRKTLLQLLEPRQQAAVQIAAVRAIGQLRDPAAAASLVDATRWQAYTPRIREVVLTTLLAEDRLVQALLDAIARKAISPAAVGALRRGRLTGHPNASIQQRAKALFASADRSSGMQAYARAQRAVLARTGDAARGAKPFSTYCSACHTFTSDGGRVGPDLSGIRNQPADAILLHILVPDFEITPSYEAYTVQTRDGRSLFGRMESETPNSLTLRDAAGQPHTILRADVASMAASAASLMPGGFEQAMSGQELADLVAYLKSAPR